MAINLGSKSDEINPVDEATVTLNVGKIIGMQCIEDSEVVSALHRSKRRAQ